ncbi:MAG: glycosyltransferase family A protein [Kiritimatiellae bacterium]|nr:glycosyltransferase family A protein [Kiritimatiellia bacterium]
MSFGQNALGTTNIVIPIYNAERHLDKLLPALERQGLSPGQFLIIDSSSTDESPSRFVNSMLKKVGKIARVSSLISEF